MKTVSRAFHASNNHYTTTTEFDIFITHTFAHVCMVFIFEQLKITNNIFIYVFIHFPFHQFKHVLAHIASKYIQRLRYVKYKSQALWRDRSNNRHTQILPNKKRKRKRKRNIHTSYKTKYGILKRTLRPANPTWPALVDWTLNELYYQMVILFCGLCKIYIRC